MLKRVHKACRKAPAKVMIMNASGKKKTFINVAMRLLGCPGWLLRCCYAVARYPGCC